MAMSPTFPWLSWSKVTVESWASFSTNARVERALSSASGWAAKRVWQLKETTENEENDVMKSVESLTGRLLRTACSQGLLPPPAIELK